MIFTYQHWDNFCRELAEKGVRSIPIREILASTANYVVLKHDVETNVPKAYRLAAIEHKYGHKGSYYVQAYLLHDAANIRLLQEMQQMVLFCSETRGVVKSVTDGSVVCLNTGHGNCVNGLFIRQDVLNAYLERNGYEMFYYVLGEKMLRLGEMNSMMRDLSAAYRYKADGSLQEVQPMRVIPREIPKPVQPDPSRIAFLRSKNSTEGLTTREMIELASLEDGASNGDILDVLEEMGGRNSRFVKRKSFII